jgi:hypothetical protein
MQTRTYLAIALLLLLLTASAWGDVTFYLQSETDVEDTELRIRR